MYSGSGIAGKFLQYLSILVIGFGVSYYFSWEADRSNKRMLANIKDVSLPIHNHSSHVSFYTDELIRLYERAVITEDEEALEESAKIIAEIRSNLAAIAYIYASDPEAHNKTLKIQEEFDLYAVSSDALSRKLILGHSSLLDVHEEIEAQSALVNRVKIETEKLKEQSHKQILQSIERSRNNIDSTDQITITIFWIMLALVGVFFFLVRSTILNPVLAISSTSQKATNGNFDYVATKPPNNEIGILIANFNNMILKIKRNRNQLNAIEKESQRLSSCGSFDSLIKAIPESITRVTLGEVDETSLSMYFRDTCFIDENRKSGFYQWKDGEWQMAHINAVKGSDGGDHLQPIRDPRSGRVIGIMSIQFSEQTPEETYKAVEVLATPVANAVAAIMLEQATQLIQRKTDEISLLLNNIDQGIFVTDGSLGIGPSYSPCLETISGSTELSGESMLERVFFGVSSEVRKNIETVFLCSIGEDQALGFDCNASSLPQEISRTVAGSDQVLQVNWVPITDSQDIVQEIMVCLEDVTELRKLEKHREKNREEMQKVYRLLKMGDKNFVGFVKSADRFYDRIVELVAQPSSHKSMIEALKLELHKHKGTARVLGLFDVATAAHEMEDSVEAVASHQICTLPQLVTDFCQLSKSKLDKYKQAYTELLGKSLDSREKFFDIDTLRFYIEKWRSMELADHRHLEDYLSVRQKGWTDLSSVVRDIVDSFRKSRNITLNIQDRLEDNFLLEGHDQIARDCMVHLFNNSIDHGKVLETDAVIELWQSESACKTRTVYHYRDNGAGLNLAAIRAKLVERNHKGAAQMDDEAVANSIFTNGLSSAESVSETSGRGVGMDVVRHAIESLHGTIAVELTQQNDQGRHSFQINMCFPSQYIATAEDVLAGKAVSLSPRRPPGRAA